MVGDDNPFLILFLWGATWALVAALVEIAEWASFGLFDYQLLGSPPAPWQVKLVWIGIGGFAGTIAAVGSGVAARWSNAAAGIGPLFLGFGLIMMLVIVEIVVFEFVWIESMEEFWVFVVLDACCYGVIGVFAALLSGRPNAPVGARALLAAPFWFLAEFIATVVHHPEIEAGILQKVLGG
jgi:hypothetical protein